MDIFLDKEYNRIISSDYRRAISAAVDCAHSMGIDIFLIGGVVRDLILDKTVKDIDIAVQGDALEFGEQLTQKFPCEIISTQENLKTIKVQFPSGVVIDFASTRQEKYSQSGVLPVAYDFGCDLKDDVKRRDFTINTLAVKLTGLNKFLLIDYFKGYEDLEKRRIRILHDRSFVDDPSRIIRALKFKARLDFKIEEYTYALMQEYLENVDKTMPLARIKSELYQYFSIKRDDLYSLLIESNAYKLVCDEPIKNILEKRIYEIQKFNLLDENELYFVYLTILFATSNYDAARMNFNTYETKSIEELKKILSKKLDEKADNRLIYETFSEATDCAIAAYYVLTGSKTVQKFLKALKDIKVLVTGNDLIDLGFIPSAQFSEIFEKILFEKLDGKLNSKDKEIEFIKKYIKK